MEAKGPLYLPLKPELITVAVEIKSILSKIAVYQHYDSGLEYRWYLQMKFYDAALARTAYALITSFEKSRFNLGYGLEGKVEREVQRLQLDPNEFSAVHLPEQNNSTLGANNVLKVRYDVYIPEEYYQLAQDALNTKLHFLPISPALSESLSHFLSLYSSLEIVRLLPFSFYPPTNTYSDSDIASLHAFLLCLAKLVIPILLPKRPVHIRIQGNTTQIIVSVDGSPKKLSPTQTRGIVALALLPYDHWFPITDFYRLINAKPDDDDPRNFGAALDIFKKEHEPFACRSSSP